MQAMLASLKEKTKALAASVLPEGTPSIPAKPVVWGSDLRAVREAMQGTIVKFGGTTPTYLIGPCNTDLNKSGTKVALSIHGLAANTTEYTMAAMKAKDAESVIFGVMQSSEGAGAHAGELRVADMQVALSADTGSTELQNLVVTVRNGQSTTKTVEEAVAMLGLEWQPWDGAAAAPPPIPAAAGIPTAAQARAQALTRDDVIEAGPAQGVAVAALEAMGFTTAGGTTCGDITAFASNATGQDGAARPAAVALAASLPAVATGEGATLIAARAAAREWWVAFRAVATAISPSMLAAGAKAVATMTGLGLPVGGAEAGNIFSTAAASEPAAQPAPTPHTGLSSNAAAMLAAALGGDDEASRRRAAIVGEGEARTRLALQPGAASLPADELEAIVAQLADALERQALSVPQSLLLYGFYVLGAPQQREANLKLHFCHFYCPVAQWIRPTIYYYYRPTSGGAPGGVYDNPA
jgi:hypothetical protein